MTGTDQILAEQERYTLQRRVEQLVGWYKAGQTRGREGEPYYLMSVEGTDKLRFDVIGSVDEVVIVPKPDGTVGLGVQEELVYAVTTGKRARGTSDR